MSDIYFHGANGDTILKILESGVLKPSGNEIFLARFEPAGCFQHGGDQGRKANYVIKVKLTIPNDVGRECTQRPGNRDTLILHTAMDIPVEVLELYIRTRNEDGDGFDFDRVEGAAAIKLRLNK